MSRRVIILALSAGGETHEGNELAQRETWAAELPSWLSVFWLKAKDSLSSVEIDSERNCIYTPGQETYGNLLQKTVFAINECLENLEFDFLIRTNTSCYFSPRAIEKKVAELGTRRFYGGKLGRYRGINYVSGSGIWLSRDMASELVSITPDKYAHLVDDVAIGDFLGRTTKLSSLDRQDVADFSPLWPSAHIRVKHAQRTNITVARMRGVHRVFSSQDGLELNRALREFDESELGIATKDLRGRPMKIWKVRRRMLGQQNQRLDAFREFLL